MWRRCLSGENGLVKGTLKGIWWRWRSLATNHLAPTIHISVDISVATEIHNVTTIIGDRLVCSAGVGLTILRSQQGMGPASYLLREIERISDRHAVGSTSRDLVSNVH